MLVTDRRVVVTGKIAGESRQTAEAKLREAGAIVQSAVNKDTDVLVIGSAVGAKKMNAARDLGVTVVPWEEAFGERASAIKAAPAPRAPMPEVHQWAPMLCKPATLPSGLGWIYEIKWDGLRGIATVKDNRVMLQSRSGKSDLTERFPTIVEELSHLPDCVLDGEIAAIQIGGDDTVRFIAFDLLEVGSRNVTSETLDVRRDTLGALIEGGTYVVLSQAFDDGEELLDLVTLAGMEGVVAKRRNSKYVEGARNDNWLKIKVRREQEFVVLGYTPGEGHRSWAFGALILGYYEADEIRYAGKVGTGFDDDCLEMLMAKMVPMRVGLSPFDVDLPRDLRGSTWLDPGIVVQVAFQKWTEDGMLWHPSYQGLREDKQPHEVMRDTYV
jgi:bifunctional non-homologous end joining protein LigD